MKRKARGLSLVEMIVVAVILGYLFYSIYQLLVPGMRVWMRSDKKVALQQNTLVSLYRLRNELKESNQHTVTLKKYDKIVDGVETLICFASARDSSGILRTKEMQFASGDPFDSGEPELQKYVIYYLDAHSRLRRYETPDYEGYKETDGMRISYEPLNVIHLNDLRTDKVVSRKIESFSIEYNPSELNWRGGLNLRIGAYDEDQDFRTSLQTTVRVRYYVQD